MPRAKQYAESTEDEQSRLYETHGGKELRIDVGPRGLWFVTSTSGGAPCAPCLSYYTSFNLAEKAVKDYLRDTAKPPKQIFITEAMRKRALLEGQAIA